MTEARMNMMTNDRYTFEKSEHHPNYWVCTDTINGLVCVFENQNYNHNQKFTLLHDSNDSINDLSNAKIIRQMADWLSQNHYRKIMPEKYW